MNFSWTDVESALQQDARRLPPSLLHGVQQHLHGLVFTPASRRPLKLSWTPPRFSCSAKTPARRGAPPRLIDVVLFSYELDLLELRMHELNASVDVFVVVEAPVTHRGVSKPLVFAEHARRFAAFASKTVHVVVSRATLHGPLQEATRAKWDEEQFYPIQIALQQEAWAAATAHVHDAARDLLILADVDEIPGAALLHELKWCEHRRGLPLLLYSDFYRFSFNHLLGINEWNAPVVVRKGDLPDGFDFIKWPGGKRQHDWALSGHHLNRFGPPALQLYKHLSNGEGGSVPGGGVALLRDPEGYGRPLVERGVRLCCENDAPRTPTLPSASALPHVVLQNLDAFRGMFSRASWARTRAALAPDAALATSGRAPRIVVPPPGTSAPPKQLHSGGGGGGRPSTPRALAFFSRPERPKPRAPPPRRPLAHAHAGRRARETHRAQVGGRARAGSGSGGARGATTHRRRLGRGFIHPSLRKKSSGHGDTVR